VRGEGIQSRAENLDCAYPTQTRPDVFHGAVGTGDGKGNQQQRRVGEMSPHEAAQSVAWFAVVVLVGVGLVLYYDIRKETKQKRKRGE
jgi:hypothetical protein